MDRLEDMDLVVIGAGMAGVTAANKCASKGWKVVVADPLPFGGTCALRGCDPKKILRRGAEVIDAARLMRGKGVHEGGLSIDWAELIRHKEGFTGPMPHNIEDGLVRNGVLTLHGAARFTDPDVVDVDGRAFRARHTLIATGARPRPMSFPGHEHLIDSTAFLDLDALPSRILFVGGGYISFEFAHIAARAGSHPIIIDRGERSLKGFDADLVDLLVARSTGAGIEVRTRSSITAIEASGSGFRVGVEQSGRREWIQTGLVVHGAGREPDLEALDLDTAGVAWTPRGVSVHDHLQSTTNSAVYAAGDAADSGALPLTPVAVTEGKVAASNMINSATRVPDHTGTPTVVFTIPELARVGLLEDQARDLGFDVDVRFNDTSGWYSNYRIGEPVAATKILINRSDDTIVGAHLLGPEYAELINILGLAMKLGLTTRQLKSMTAAYPSVGSDLGSML